MPVKLRHERQVDARWTVHPSTGRPVLAWQAPAAVRPLLPASAPQLRAA
jgi:hypothetical protein